MSNDSIRKILESKPHNVHYLNRYIKFVESCSNNSVDIEKHHICPKAKDLFPEYKSFRQNPWNKVALTRRQHFIAHWMLWKAYGGSQTSAFWRMCCKGMKSSRTYESLRSDFVSAIKARVDAGTHNFQSEEHRKKNGERASARNKRLAEAGEFHSQKQSFRNKLSDRNTKLVNEGSHQFQRKDVRDAASNRQVSRMKDGTHNFQKPEQIERMKNNNPSQTEEFKSSMSSRIRAAGSRPIVAKIREFIKSNNIKLGKAWHLKSDEWMHSKAQELGIV